MASRVFFKEKNIPLSNIMACATDGAPSMIGRHLSFTSFLKTVVPGVLTVYCVIHRQHIVAKNLSDRLHKTVVTVITAVNKDFLMEKKVGIHCSNWLQDWMPLSISNRNIQNPIHRIRWILEEFLPTPFTCVIPTNYQRCLLFRKTLESRTLETIVETSYSAWIMLTALKYRPSLWILFDMQTLCTLSTYEWKKEEVYNSDLEAI